MMGPRKEAQAASFCEFRIEDHVPSDYLLGLIDRFFDLSGFRRERRLCREAHLNLAYRWLYRLDQGNTVPGQRILPKNRHGRFRKNDVFHQLFESVVARRIKIGPFGPSTQFCASPLSVSYSHA